jgi:hypothetical protein
MVTFTPTVAGQSGAGTPSGSVIFEEGSTTLGTGTLDSSGQTSFTTTTLAPGSEAITAVYTPTGNFQGSSSTTLTQIVNAPALAATATQVTSSADPSTVGQSVTFTAVVTSSASGTPTGTVSFTIDGQEEPPVSLSMVNGVDQAMFSTTSLAVGPHTISAAYGGDTTFAPSTVATSLTQTINAPVLQPTSTLVTSSPNPAIVGQSVTFTATVDPPTGAPTGTVTFTIDGKAGAPVPLTVVNGQYQASFSTATLAAGSYTIAAAYSGDSNFAPSNSSAETQVVTPPIIPVVGDGPTIVSVLRYGYHMMPTSLVLTFDQALDSTTAQDAKNYRVIGPAGGIIGIKSAVYDPATLTVMLHPLHLISIHRRYELIVDGTAPRGLTNTRGQLLDGADKGQPASDYRASLTWRNLVLDPHWPRTSRKSKSPTVLSWVCEDVRG